MTSAREWLGDVIQQLAVAGLPVPCLGRNEWISENPADRALAVELCQGCPALLACDRAAASSNERFGVWAGIDRSPTTRGPGRAGGGGVQSRTITHQDPSTVAPYTHEVGVPGHGP